ATRRPSCLSPPCLSPPCLSPPVWGNTGIGRATALRLAGLGARVVLACRNQDKAREAVTGSTDVVYMLLDLGSFRSVRSFAESFLKAEKRLDLLINNAGLLTTDGFGIEFGVNHLGHFLLTNLLLERLQEGGGGRVVTLSSIAYRWGHIDFQVGDLNACLFFSAYCNSKLCNVLFTLHLAKRLQGSKVTCYSVHPGETSPKAQLCFHVLVLRRVVPIARLLFLDPATGAQTTLHCALQEGIEPFSGRHFSCCAVEELTPRGRDHAVAQRLWEVSEQLCGLSSTS
uniref:Dehydrogenase/reductase SDR family member 13-like n=1 Tax=Gadus morhua TaxID=8049 RepID=A0A8C5BUK7_GADMO